ncbi:MAG: LacI family transcriptional regulator [Firmicutes bacterium HGW-Firmicutes-7]|nr:MAG: LacI family transcriptional regulator [Firmicutes bacterium HGW-Firmicutes-7]
MKITIKHIAQEAGVSTATVSKVINKKDEHISAATVDRIMKIVKEYNYIPNGLASSMVTKKTKTLGLLIPDITNPFFPEIARGVEDKANEENYSVIFCNTDDDLVKEEKCLAMLIEKMVDAIIIVPSAERTKDFNSLKNISIPIVFVDRDLEIDFFTAKVLVDNYEGSYNAVTYLIENEYRKIAFITGPSSTKTSQQRLEGYKKALEDGCIRYDEKYVLEGTFKREWGKQAIQQLIEQKIDFDAVYCGDDIIAIGAMKALKEKGYKIPDDIGVMGYDNIYISELVEPSLSTVRQPNYDMGSKAVSIALEAIDDKQIKGEVTILKTALIIRKSTKKR